MQVVLASLSPYRRAQLSAFGIPYIPQAPQVDEEALKRQGPKDLVELTRFLAAQKAQSLAAQYPGGIVIGSDQLAELNGERLDKPGTAAKALEQLRRLSGQTHRLITSLAVIHKGRTLIETEITHLTMRRLDQDYLKAYLATDEPYDCAGSYKIEKAGLSLIEKVVGDDPSAIQGLPLIALTRCLLQLGVSPQTLWRPA
ncbi:MAG: septum formation protein Maf [Bdellovibrionales bacterium]|nr:septum formation protein Maf [Bdellovibrionales bacterium]